ncbi:MAG: tRNA (cytidine(56)-2'-O)-methyltransferase, partial [Thermoproteota archaeon]
MSTPGVVVFRYGHRPSRDKRVSTHLALVARAFGAREAWFDSIDSRLEEKVAQVNRVFGGKFSVKTGISWREAVEMAASMGFCTVHLTMYGVPLPQVIEELRRKENILVMVGGPKVPKAFYDLADYNVSLTNQPHSEVAALAVF